MRRRSGPVRHAVRIDPELTDPRTGVEYCADAPHGCGLPATHPIHDLPEREQDERDHEERRMGER